MQIRVLMLSDLDAIQTFEKNLLNDEDEMSRMFVEWKASWRKESLEFYLPNGWCFGIFDNDDNLMAYFLAQPILFFRAQMQSLWVEHLSTNDESLRKNLVDIAYRTAREKHLQKLLLSQDSIRPTDLAGHKFETKTDFFEINTTKMEA